MNRLVMLAALVAVAALAAYFVFSPGTRQDTPAGQGAQGPGDPIADVKLPATLPPQAEIGKTAFAAKCAECHGENAGGRQGKGPPLVHKIYEPSHHADMSFLLAVQNGVRSHHWNFGDMPAVEGLTRADVANIVSYVRVLQFENGIR